MQPGGASDGEFTVEGQSATSSTGSKYFPTPAKSSPTTSPATIRAEPIRWLTNKWDRVAVRGSATARRNVLCMFKPLRPGQTAGRAVDCAHPRTPQAARSLVRCRIQRRRRLRPDGHIRHHGTRTPSTTCTTKTPRVPSSTTPANGPARWKAARPSTCCPAKELNPQRQAGPTPHLTPSGRPWCARSAWPLKCPLKCSSCTSRAATVPPAPPC